MELVHLFFSLFFSLLTLVASQEEPTSTSTTLPTLATNVGYTCTPEWQSERPVPRKQRIKHEDCILLEFAGYLEMRKGDGGFIELKNGRVIHQSECTYSFHRSILTIRFDNCAEIGIMFNDQGPAGSYLEYFRYAHWQGDQLVDRFMLQPGGMRTSSPELHYRCDSEQLIEAGSRDDLVLHLSQLQFEVFRSSASDEFTTSAHVCPQDSDRWW